MCYFQENYMQKSDVGSHVAYVFNGRYTSILTYLLCGFETLKNILSFIHLFIYSLFEFDHNYSNKGTAKEAGL